MSKHKPHLRGERNSDETKAIWDLAAEGRPASHIVRVFGLDANAEKAIRQWQDEQGVEPNPGKCRACPRACR